MMIDVNVSLSRWAFRRLPLDEVPRLVDKFRALGVTQAWAGSFDGMFHKDVDGVNIRLAEDCRQGPSGLLRPFGTVNPMLPDWLQGSAAVSRSPPHAGHSPASELSRLSSRSSGFRRVALGGRCQRGLLMQLVVRLEDLRMQHPLMRVLQRRHEAVALSW